MKDDQGEREVMVPFWNPTIANLTLVALGSSAPEIIMATLDTVLTLGDCPGELGASCIVGSAAFNLLVISGLSIYAVKKEKGASDEPDEDGTKPGYKIIKDLGVFGITATSSILAYVWLWIVLLDMQVSVAEAWITFLLFPLLVGLAFWADQCNQKKDDDEDKTEGLPVIDFHYVELQRELIQEKSGKADKSEAAVKRREEMKKFLRETMGHDDIMTIDKDELKTKMEGNSLLSRIQYRKQVGMAATKPTVAKLEVVKYENAHAS